MKSTSKYENSSQFVSVELVIQRHSSSKKNPKTSLQVVFQKRDGP